MSVSIWSGVSEDQRISNSFCKKGCFIGGKVGRWESGKVLKWEGWKVGKWEGGIERPSRDSEDPVDDRTHCNADRTNDEASVVCPAEVIKLIAF